MIVLIIIAILISVVYFWKYKKVNRLREIRDNFDLTTPEGRALIRAYNYQIDKLNGSNVFNRKSNK